jgi:hypothetical protein
MAKDKLALVAKVTTLRSNKQRAALQASTAAVSAKRADIMQLKGLQTDYERQISDWQSGLAMALRDRLSMHGNLTVMLRHLGEELAQLERMEQRCADALRRSLQQVEGLDRLQEKRHKIEQLKIKRAERRGQ